MMASKRIACLVMNITAKDVTLYIETYKIMMKALKKNQANQKIAVAIS